MAVPFVLDKQCMSCAMRFPLKIQAENPQIAFENRTFPSRFSENASRLTAQIPSCKLRPLAKDPHEAFEIKKISSHWSPFFLCLSDSLDALRLGPAGHLRSRKRYEEAGGAEKLSDLAGRGRSGCCSSARFAGSNGPGRGTGWGLTERRNSGNGRNRVHSVLRRGRPSLSGSCVGGGEAAGKVSGDALKQNVLN